LAFTKAKNFAFMNQQPTFEIDFERMSMHVPRFGARRPHCPFAILDPKMDSLPVQNLESNAKMCPREFPRTSRAARIENHGGLQLAGDKSLDPRFKAALKSLAPPRDQKRRMTVTVRRGALARPPRNAPTCGSTKPTCEVALPSKAHEQSAVHTGAHMKISTTNDQAAARPMNLFARRGRGGIAPVQMDVIKPWKPRTDGELAILSAPATHIRLGATETQDGRFLSCIDIHTYEFFLMKEKDAVVPPPAAVAPSTGLGELEGTQQQVLEAETEEPAAMSVDAAEALVGQASCDSIDAASALAELSEGPTPRAADEEEQDQEAKEFLGILLPTHGKRDKRGRDCSDAGVDIHAVGSPVSSSCRSPEAAESTVADSEVWSAPPSAGALDSEDKMLGCMRGSGCVIVSSRSPEVASPHTPRNVDAVTTLFSLHPRQGMEQSPVTTAPPGRRAASHLGGATLRGRDEAEGKNSASIADRISKRRRIDRVISLPPSL